MNRLLYTVFLFLYHAGIRVAALFNPKAKKWVAGRRAVFSRLKSAIGSGNRIIWMHCASLGEFEQGRPVLEQLKKEYPAHQMLLTFFSPSGYEVRKNYAGADWVFYLPPDGKKNAARFIETVKPELAIFVKYEFWFYYLNAIRKNKVPLLLISAIFREKQPFFRWYGALHRQMLRCFSHIFVQDRPSLQLLHRHFPGLPVSVAGDTRFDRVAALRTDAAAIPLIEAWIKHSPVIVAGSTWPEDERLLQKVMAAFPGTDLIIAPHEITETHIRQLHEFFPQAQLYSSLQNGETSRQATGSRILIIDNIGMLSRLYSYGKIAYIGGGFGKGIHNTLEAAVYGMPVLFGPAFQKFKEAKDLVANGAALPVANDEEAVAGIQKLLADATLYSSAAAAAAAYVQTSTGATRLITGYIQEKRLLTS